METTTAEPSWVEADGLSRPLLSLIVPCLNEAENVVATHSALVEVLVGIPRWELVYIDDGSTDDTWNALLRIWQADDRVRLIKLTRTFGHQSAILAGLGHAAGRVVVSIDADLQDPPELIPEFLTRWRAGFLVVYGRPRRRRGENALRLTLTSCFYRLLTWMSDVPLIQGVADFRLMDRRVVDALRQVPNHHYFLRGAVQWLGFPACIIDYDRRPRAGGRSKYSWWKLAKLAACGFALFGTQKILVLAVGIALTSWLLFGISFLQLLFGNSSDGTLRAAELIMWTSNTALLLLLSAGLWMILRDVRSFPAYIVQETRRNRTNRKVVEQGHEASSVESI